MTKHTPATPLPWHEKQVHLNYQGRVLMHSIEGGTRRLDDQSGHFTPEDAAYLAHAANAYPKLIDTLRAVNAAVHPFDSIANRLAAAAAYALLRELGEAE